MYVYVFAGTQQVMPLSNAERLRRYREKLKADPERYNEHKKKEKKRYHDNKVYGTVKLINEKTERSQRHQRRKWKRYKRTQRQKLKDVEKRLTPPASPVSDDLIHQLRFLHVLVRKSNLTRKETERKLKSIEIIAY